MKPRLMITNPEGIPVSADTCTTKPDLWNTDQVRAELERALTAASAACQHCIECDCATNAAMEVLRDVLAVVGAAQADSAVRSQIVAERLDVALHDARDRKSVV